MGSLQLSFSRRLDRQLSHRYSRRLFPLLILFLFLLPLLWRGVDRIGVAFKLPKLDRAFIYVIENVVFDGTIYDDDVRVDDLHDDDEDDGFGQTGVVVVVIVVVFIAIAAVESGLRVVLFFRLLSFRSTDASRGDDERPFPRYFANEHPLYDFFPMRVGVGAPLARLGMR